MEIPEHDGLYVLVDDGPSEEWTFSSCLTPRGVLVGPGPE
jgi:hypothetical protein